MNAAHKRSSFRSLVDFRRVVFTPYMDGPGLKGNILVMHSNSNLDENHAKFIERPKVSEDASTSHVANDQWHLELLEIDKGIPLSTMPEATLHLSLHKTVSVVKLPPSTTGRVMAFNLKFWRTGGDRRNNRRDIAHESHSIATSIQDVFISIHGSTTADAKWLAAHNTVLSSITSSSVPRASPSFRLQLRQLIDDILNSLDVTNNYDAELWMHHQLSGHLSDILPGARIDWLDVAVEYRRIKLSYDGPLNSLKLIPDAR